MGSSNEGESVDVPMDEDMDAGEPDESAKGTSPAKSNTQAQQQFGAVIPASQMAAGHSDRNLLGFRSEPTSHRSGTRPERVLFKREKQAAASNQLDNQYKGKATAEENREELFDLRGPGNHYSQVAGSSNAATQPLAGAKSTCDAPAQSTGQSSNDSASNAASDTEPYRRFSTQKGKDDDRPARRIGLTPEEEEKPLFGTMPSVIKDQLRQQQSSGSARSTAAAADSLVVPPA